jgi:hypothetical protein
MIEVKSSFALGNFTSFVHWGQDFLPARGQRWPQNIIFAKDFS